MNAVNSTLRRVPASVIYIMGAAWAGWLFYLGVTGQLGIEPVEELEHAYGEIALQLLIFGLAITPLRKHLGLNLLKFRRAIGVTSFFFVLAHFLVWALLDVQTASAVWADIVKRPYVTIGMAAFVLMIPLAVTSNNLSLRKMGAAAWRKLHWLTYPVALLGALHFVWLAKGFQIEPLMYLAAVLVLLGLRIRNPAPRVAVSA